MWCCCCCCCAHRSLTGAESLRNARVSRHGAGRCAASAPSRQAHLQLLVVGAIATRRVPGRYFKGCSGVFVPTFPIWPAAQISRQSAFAQCFKPRGGAPRISSGTFVRQPAFVAACPCVCAPASFTKSDASGPPHLVARVQPIDPAWEMHRRAERFYENLSRPGLPTSKLHCPIQGFFFIPVFLF